MTKLPYIIRRPYAAANYRIRHWLAQPHESPIFILGNQKSGTTAIAALLAKATGQQATLDFFFRRNPKEVQDYHQGKLSLSDICTRNKLEFSRKIIKDPDLTFFASDLTTTFPGARFVFIVRDPYQNVRSILNRWSIPGTLSQLTPVIKKALATSPSWQIVFEGASPQTAGSNYVATLANRWTQSVKAYRQIQSRCLLVRYEDFCLHKEDTILKMANQLDLTIRHDISQNLNHPYQPPGADSGKTPLQFFNQNNLQKITEQCWPTAQIFQYQPVPAQNHEPES